MNERFECANCFSVQPLDLHGRCASCGSNAVFPEASIVTNARLSTNNSHASASFQLTAFCGRA